jgi:hypothetical protein
MIHCLDVESDLHHSRPRWFLDEVTCHHEDPPMVYPVGKYRGGEVFTPMSDEEFDAYNSERIAREKGTWQRSNMKKLFDAMERNNE